MRGQRIGLATDTGGGSSFSMLRTMAAAYEIGQLRGTPLHAAQLLWLATVGIGAALRMDDCRSATLRRRDGSGSGRAGSGLDPGHCPAMLTRAQDLWEAVFPTIMMGDDRAIAEVWIGVRRKRAREEALASAAASGGEYFQPG